MMLPSIRQLVASGVLAVLIGSAPQARQGAAPARGRGLTDVAGLKVGHHTLSERPTGCTVVLVDGEGVAGGVAQRGSAPGTRETDLLDPLNMVDKVNAIVLAGGSAFGLDAAQGVVKYLDERKVGW
ncbi:MAG: P1 family peptidase, partial [Vicinamibacterales bacterium]